MVQKSRQNLTQLGDRNNRYFQTITLNRRRENRIWKIRDLDSLWFDNQNEISRAFINDFSKIFKSERLRMIPKWFDSFNPCISKEENMDLIKEVIDEEILATLSQMSNLKSPGPDGLQASFYQKYWKIVRKFVCKMVRAFFYNGHLLKEINRTVITLIPKLESPEASHHYRPISLCNVSYKIIAKILANRVKPLLNKIFSPLQGSFAPGRLINDNIMQAYEIMHSFKKKKVRRV